MSEALYYLTRDNVKLKLFVENTENPKGLILVWPCTLGDVRMYKVPARQFAQKGYKTIQFNPRGHGNSQGQFDIDNSIKDL